MTTQVKTAIVYRLELVLGWVFRRQIHAGSGGARSWGLYRPPLAVALVRYERGGPDRRYNKGGEFNRLTYTRTHSRELVVWRGKPGEVSWSLAWVWDTSEKVKAPERLRLRQQWAKWKDWDKGK